MLVVNRAGFNFTWREMYTMPRSKLLKYKAIADEFFRQQEEQYGKDNNKT